jgi:hypothetical protein
MIDNARLLRCALPSLRAVLVRHYGWLWPLALVRCAVRWRTLFGQTRWAGRDDDEARQVRALALIPAVYLMLRERLGASALALTQELAAGVLAAANARLAREVTWPATGDPRARWHAFFDRAVARGVGAFNESECLSVDLERFQFRVRRCLFADIARDIGLPELARMTCDLAVPFCRELLPSYAFRRNGSPESTLAYGHPHCDYVWEPKDAAGAAASEPAPSTEASRPAEKPAAAGATAAPGSPEIAERSDA